MITVKYVDDLFYSKESYFPDKKMAKTWIELNKNYINFYSWTMIDNTTKTIIDSYKTQKSEE